MESNKVECPHCHNQTVPGEKCEQCGKRLDAITDVKVAAIVKSQDQVSERAVRMDAAGHVQAAQKVHLTIVWIFGAIGLAAIGMGVVALGLNSQGTTKFHFLADLSTSNVGVACLGIGLICLVLGVRAVLKNIVNLAKLPGNSEPRKRK